MRWRQFSCSAICYWFRSSAMSCMLSTSTTTGHLQLQSVLEKCFQSSALGHYTLPQVHSSHLWKWGLFFLAHQHLAEIKVQKLDAYTYYRIVTYSSITSITFMQKAWTALIHLHNIPVVNFPIWELWFSGGSTTNLMVKIGLSDIQSSTNERKLGQVNFPASPPA